MPRQAWGTHTLPHTGPPLQQRDNCNNSNGRSFYVKASSMKFTTVCCGAAVPACVVIGVICIIASFVRVNDDEVCQLFYPDGVKDSNIEAATSPGNVFVGPGGEKHCVTRSTQHLEFTKSKTTGLGRLISVTSSEGVPVTLEVDIEFQIDPERFDQTVARTGFGNNNMRLMRTARAEVRDVASGFEIKAFLQGSREAIATQIRQSFQTKLETDGVFIDIKKVNLLHIDVDTAFEALYQKVEDRRLQQLVAKERINIITIDENRLNQTQSIEKVALRNVKLRTAEADTVRVQLDQERQLTEANTAFQQAIILAESDRINRNIRATTLLEKQKASRTLKVQAMQRVALANKTLAETDRENMVAVALGTIDRARADASRDLALAQIERSRKLEQIISLEIAQNLEVFEIKLEADVTAAEIKGEGEAAASETQASERAKTNDWIMLKETLGLDDKTLANLLLYRSMGSSGDATVTVDHDAIPFSLLEGDINGGVSVLAPSGSA